jgi:hypothetical protein
MVLRILDFGFGIFDFDFGAVQRSKIDQEREDQDEAPSSLRSTLAGLSRFALGILHNVAMCAVQAAGQEKAAAAKLAVCQTAQASSSAGVAWVPCPRLRGHVFSLAACGAAGIGQGGAPVPFLRHERRETSKR